MAVPSHYAVTWGAAGTGANLRPPGPREDMNKSSSPLDPRVAEERFARMLAEAGLPRFDSSTHLHVIQMLELSWDHGFTVHIDLTRTDEFEPIDDWERARILDEPLPCVDEEPIHVYVGGSSDDPRTDTSIPGLVIHRGPELHPDDLTVHDGIPCTSPSRTLIDLAEMVNPDELREAFARARELGLLDPGAIRQARARVEWRPSLPVVDEVIAEFCD